MRIPFFYLCLPILFASASTARAQAITESKPETAGVVTNALTLKFPLPDQPSREDRERSKGEISVELKVNSEGKVESMKQLDGPSSFFYRFQSFIKQLRFEAAQKTDPGPWHAVVKLVSTGQNPGKPNTTSMQIKLVNSQGITNSEGAK